MNSDIVRYALLNICCLGGHSPIPEAKVELLVAIMTPRRRSELPKRRRFERPFEYLPNQ